MPSFGTAVERDGPVVRPDAPAEYDLIVAQLLMSEGRTAEALEAFLRAVEKDPESAFLQQRAAASLAQNHRLDEALEHAEAGLALDASDEQARLFAGQLYRIRRRTGDAERVLTAAPGEPVSLDSAFLLYQIYLDAGRSDDALQTAEWMVAEAPDLPRGRIAVANVYNRLGRRDEAEAVLRDALAASPGNLHLYTSLAHMLHTREAYVAEIALHREVLELYPGRHASMMALGEAQLRVDDPEAALATFMAVEASHPKDLDVRLRLGFLFFESHRYLEARERFEHVLVRRPRNHEVAFFLGVVDRRIGDVDSAIEAFARIPEEHKYFADARSQIASAHERRGDYAAALEEVERSLAVREAREMQLYAATLRAKTGDLEGAVRAVEELIEQAPDDDELLFNLGVVYGEADRSDEAVSYMRKALEVNPENASAMNYIGYTFAEQGVHLDEAEQLIMRAIELRPDDGYIVDSLGWVYYMRARPLVKSGRSAEARPLLQRAEAELSRAHELTGGDPVISEHLGDLYLLLDEKVRALEKFEEAIRLEPRQGEQPMLVEKFETLRQEIR
ncbi:MAG: tetratricopeptide repeat protein [Deltaproteobacteria bacterium]|nr:tetratricopeptide repeat protein [Deltaproteobacteria bacterium]